MSMIWIPILILIGAAIGAVGMYGVFAVLRTAGDDERQNKKSLRRRR